MALDLRKGEKLDLTKRAPLMTHATVGLGWRERTTIGDEFDLDLSVLLADANGRSTNAADVVFYNQPHHVSGAARSLGDDRRGGDGDSVNERLELDLVDIPEHYGTIIVIVSIDRADERRQNFGSLLKAFINVTDTKRDVEALRFSLTDDELVSSATAMQFGIFTRRPGGWDFNADVRTFSSLADAMMSYGQDVL